MKKKKKSQRADRVQWPSFSCRLVRLVSGCHIGHSTASDFRAERAVCWVGGQMEGGCTAQLSSASLSPPLAHTASPLISLSLSPSPSPVHSFIHSANPSSLRSYTFPALPAISQSYFIALRFPFTSLWTLNVRTKKSKVCASNLAQR